MIVKLSVGSVSDLPDAGKAAGFTLAGTKRITRRASAVFHTAAYIHPINPHIGVAARAGFTGGALHLQVQNNPHGFVNKIRSMLRLPLIVNIVMNVYFSVVYLRHPDAIGMPVSGTGHSGLFTLPASGVSVLPVNVTAFEFHNIAFRWPAVGTGQPKGGPGATCGRCLNAGLQLVVGIIVIYQDLVLGVNRA